MNINITFGEPKTLSVILSQLEKLMSFVEDLTAEVADLTSKVTEIENTADSAIELIKGLNAKIQALADAGLGDPTQAAAALEQLKALGNSIEAQSIEIHDAIVANVSA